ncbi:hypothetical protein Daesc_007314 [Daldinia eschscholtzii]|uniref:DUF7580 domain-containing protein n=1 Tax=Daldinia eschscholtzii TaxID=292717 RepID=A0AAX6MDR7_9PEZI
MFSSIKSVKYDLNCLERDLETERVRLQNTCETLLTGIVPSSMIDRMIENPFSDEWKGYSDQINIRLWKSKKIFESHVAEMSVATKELKEKLDIQVNGYTNLTDRLSIIRELKKGASFTLRRKDYENALSRIKVGNSVLQDLAVQNRGLESGRRSRSQTQATVLLRKLSSSLYDGISSVLPCRCDEEHSLGLELQHRTATFLPNDTEEKLAKRFHFNVALNSYGSFGVEGEDYMTSVSKDGEKSMRWNSLELRLVGYNSLLNPSSIIPTPSLTRPSISSLHETSSAGLNSIGSRAIESLEKGVNGLVIGPTIGTSLSEKPNSLCQFLQIHFSHDLPYLGFILHGGNKFGLYHSFKPLNVETKVTLRQAIDGSQTNLPPFHYPERVRIALALSLSVLHLYDTPWLANVIELDDIVFFQTNSPTLPCNYSPYRPFVTKRHTLGGVPRITPKGKSSNTPKLINYNILSLGALLTQLVIGRVVEELVITDDMDISSVVSKREILSQLADSVLENGGMNYLAVVKWCFENIHNAANMQNDRFCQDFFEAVVVRLEEDVKLLTEYYFGPKQP